MPSCVIEKFKGIDRKSASTDIDKDAAQELVNFNQSDKPGALTKDGEYADAASALFGTTLPASITWQNLAEMNLTLPDNRDIYVLHGKDAGNDHHLYVSPYYDGSAFQNAFLKLTECEGRLTAGVGTNGSTIVCSGLASSANDYYNGWFVYLNNAAAGVAVAAVVVDYVGSTKTLSFKTSALGSGGLAAASGDTFYISRFPLLGNFGSSSPDGIANVDDIIRFHQGENKLIGMTGNGFQFPTQYMLWYGYINRYYGNGSPSQQYKNFWLDSQQMLKPYADEAPASNVTCPFHAYNPGVVAGSLTIGTWYFYYAFEYDGYQIGPLSEPFGKDETATPDDGTETSGSLRTIRVHFFFPINGGYLASHPIFSGARFIRTFESEITSYNNILLSRRITGVYFFAKKPGETTIRLINTGHFSGANPLSLMNIDTADSDFDFDANEQYLSVDNGTGYFDLDSDPTGDTYEELVGQTGVRPNFKFGAALDDHFLGAGIITDTDEPHDNWLIASSISGDGVATPDSFGSNIINLGFYGGRNITGIKVVGDIETATSPKRRLMVFTDDQVFLLAITSGSSFNFQLDRIGEREGVVAPDSIISAEGRAWGVSRNGFRMFTERGTQIIGEGVKPDFDALTDPSEAIGAYFKKKRLLVWIFPTDNIVFTCNLLTDTLEFQELSLAHAMTILLGKNDGGLLSMTASAIYAHDSGTTQAGTTITPLWKSKKLGARDFFDERGFPGPHDADFYPTEGFITYRSDTAITLNVYKDGSGTAMTFNNLSLPAASTETTVRFQFPAGTRARHIELEITLSASQKASNTVLVVNAVKVECYFKKRLS